MKKISIFLMLLAFSLGFSQPTTAAPTPTKAVANVLSVYSDAYTTNVVPNFNFNTFQGGGTITNEMNFAGIAGNSVGKILGLTYYGAQWDAQNVSGFGYVHLDYYTDNSTAFNFYLIDKNANIPGGNPAEPRYAVSSPVKGSWQSIDIPLSTFSTYNTGTFTYNLSNIFQYKFDGGGDIYFDNIYFWKASTSSTTDATLSDLKVNGTTISGFSSATTSYNYILPTGTAMVPTISATTTQAMATETITQATTLPGSATVVVKATDGTTMKTYTVNYLLSGPATHAPTPPARNASDVVSFFSDAYMQIPVDSQDAGYCGANSVELIQVQGDNTERWTGKACQGIDFSSAGKHHDLSTFDHLHVDIYTEDTSLVGKVFNLKLVNFGGGAGESSSLQVNINDGSNPGIKTTGSWISIDVPITMAGGVIAGSTAREDIAQAVISSNLSKVWYDNFYVYKGSALATNEVSGKNSLQIYPNPVAANSNFYITGKVKSVKIYSMNGQLVKTSSSTQVNTQGLSKGVYIVEAAQEDGSMKRSKLIVK